MKRRKFLVLFGGIVAPLPFASRAQERPRGVGVLMGVAENDRESQRRVAAFEQELAKSGWRKGENIRIEYRWGVAGFDQLRSDARGLVALKPDVILANGTPTVEALKQENITVPVVFVQVPDPVAVGFVAGMARPGGSMTGFASFEYTIGGKWLELLKEIAPRLTRAMFVINRKNPAWSGLLASAEAAALKFGVKLTAADVRSSADVERTIAGFAQEPDGGLIVQPDRTTVVHRALITTLAQSHRLPAIYPFRFFAETGGLLSYGIDVVNVYRQAAGYVDRVLRGEKPADLPVQAPTRFELVINLRTAKALGLAVPPVLLARADAMIE